MIKTGHHSISANTMLRIALYIPLTIAGIYSAASLYELIYPSHRSAASASTEAHAKAGFFAKMFDKLKWVIYPVLSFFKNTIGAIISPLLEYIVNNPFRIIALVVLILYMVGSYYFTFLYGSNEALKKWSLYTNSILIIFGVILSIAVFTLFEDKGRVILEGSKVKGKQKSTGEKLASMVGASIPFYKSLIGISVAILIAFLLLWLITTFSFLSLTFSVVIGILAIIGVLFVLFRLISANSGLMRTISSSKVLQVLFKLITLLPRTIISVTELIWKEIKETPYLAWVLLLVEIASIGAYFMLPIIIRLMYTHSVTKNDDILERSGNLARDESIVKKENQLDKLLKGVSVDWKAILSKGLYKKNLEPVLEQYLIQQGYRPINSGKKLTFLEWISSKSMGLKAAVTYVQTNGPVIIDLRNDIKMQLSTRQNMNAREKDRASMLKTKILLNEPIYTDKKTVIGTYENIGVPIGVFNYNYAISAWFFIHEQPPSSRIANTVFTSILDYADKPNVLFNVEENKLRITMNDGVDKKRVIYETEDFPLQRWNNVVVNYNGGTLDIFINAKLVSSTSSIVPFMTSDAVTTGSDEGVSGGIANVTYFPSPLSLSQIKMFYKSLKWRNPPII